MFGFTLFGPDDFLDNFVSKLNRSPEMFPQRLKYLICQEEVTATGRRHLQGYVEWTRRVAYTSLRSSVFDLPRRTETQRQCELEDRTGLELLARKGVYLWNVKVCDTSSSLFSASHFSQWGGKVSQRDAQEQMIKYCTKAETHIAGPWQYGTPSVYTRGASVFVHMRVYTRSCVLSLLSSVL